MKRFIAWSLLVLGLAFITGCNQIGAGEENKPDAPTGVKVTPGDSGVIMTWDVQSGVEYWIFLAAAPSISTSNWTTLPGARAVRGAVSPQIIAGLFNGTVYSFTVNGRFNNGPGGEGSPSIAAVPRVSGNFWSAGTPLPSQSLNAIFYLGTTIPGRFTTVGAGGTLFISSDGVSWTPVNSGVTADLYGVTYGIGRYVAVGKGGAMTVSTDGAAWTTIASSTASDLNAVTVGSNGLIAVGANGTIVRSTDGGNWGAVQSPTTQNLNGVTFVNNTYFATGAQGTLVTSTSGDVWTVVTTPTAADLKGLAWNGSVYVAVGAAGTIITSPDAVTWTVVTPVTTANLNSITLGSQFIMAGSGGTILSSVDGINWGQEVSGTTSDLNAVLFGGVGYTAVGVGGVNLTSY